MHTEQKVSSNWSLNKATELFKLSDIAMLQKFAGPVVGAPFLWGPLFGRTCWTCLNPPLDFGTNRKLIYDFLLVINTNLSRILHRFRDIAFGKSKIAIFCYPSWV